MPKKKLQTKKKAKAPVQAKCGSQAKAKKRKRPFVSTRFRDFICGHVYHIFQRGNHGRSVFRTDKERFKYLENLSLFALRYSVKIHNFCLMPTHVHLVLEQRLKNGISNMMRDLQAGHARAHNRSLNTFGNLWTQHFGCKHVKNDAYYQTLMWYVENNPVKTSSCERAEDYKWSGAHVHAAGGSRNPSVHGARHHHFALHEEVGGRLQYAGMEEAAERRRRANEDGRSG